ncbi:MAG: class I SAM-dependent methyltransferase [Anaerolineales bacterium]|nr:class I SAM-dependent methyltransferase [Anaerolineales bacterium]
MTINSLAHLPPPREKRLALRVTRTAEQILRNGHPWLFDQAINQQSHEGQPGDLAVIFDRKRQFLAIGLYDPDSPLRVRILHHGKPTPIDKAWFADKISTAVAVRQPLLEKPSHQETNGYRLIYGEGDGLPGVVVDRYADTLVMKLYTAAWIPYLPLIVPLLLDSQPAERVVLRLSRLVQARPQWCYGLRDGQTLVGEAPTKPVLFWENGLRFAADVVQGHKTGFFFDHRPNRELVRSIAADKNVLDVFAYTGAFSLYAAAGGAKNVTSLDISEPALETACYNFDLNRQYHDKVLRCSHHTIIADAFDGLAQLQTQGRQFDLVVVDPPSFAKSQDEVDGALQAYERLTRLALGVLAPQGLLVIASCSSRILPYQFFQTVLQAAEDEGRPLWEQKRTAHALDHPVLPQFPEGAYLKCLFATAVD